SASRAATGRSTPATATTGDSSSPRPPGRPPAGCGTPRGRTWPPRPNRSPSRRPCPCRTGPCAGSTARSNGTTRSTEGAGPVRGKGPALSFASGPNGAAHRRDAQDGFADRVMVGRTIGALHRPTDRDDPDRRPGRSDPPQGFPVHADLDVHDDHVGPELVDLLEQS